MIELGSERIHPFDEPEWLVTNGIGGYASGSVSGSLNTRYHGLLIAALKPPLGRTLLLSQFNETVSDGEAEYPLSLNHSRAEPRQHRSSPFLLKFTLEGTIPVWTFAFADALLEKRVWMARGHNTTYVRYTLLRASRPCRLHVRPLVNERDSHLNTHNPAWIPHIEPTPRGVRVRIMQDSTPLYLSAANATFHAQVELLRDLYLSGEHARGLDEYDDHFAIGTFDTTLAQGESVTFVASTQPDTSMDADAEYAAYRQHEQRLLGLAHSVHEPGWIQQLVLAADQFIVARPLPDHSAGLTVLAGYPWFGDWGRDTMIALPGLTLATGRADIAATILRTFARFVDQGMLPNRFPDEGEHPEYNTVDATLWYFQAVRQYVEATGDLALLRELYPILVDVISWHERGTRFNIHVDPADGLLVAGEPDVQLTWMDVKIHARYLPTEQLQRDPATLWLPAFVGLLQRLGVSVTNWVVTPRTGKQVEINALWYNALLTMTDFSHQLGAGFVSNDYAQRAERVKASFARFWNQESGYCYDVIDTPDGTPDPTLRPNQLFAVSLPHSPLTIEQQRQIIDACARNLLTPCGLRSLSADHPHYQGTFTGNLVMRDSAYHQGTVWSWLIGAFVEAHLRVYGDPAAARSYLLPFKHHLNAHGLGTISEVFSGDAPHQPGGCLAQAWGVAEVLRAWRLCESRPDNVL